jgi:hypothetical protein
MHDFILRPRSKLGVLQGPKRSMTLGIIGSPVTLPMHVQSCCTCLPDLALVAAFLKRRSSLIDASFPEMVYSTSSHCNPFHLIICRNIHSIAERNAVTSFSKDHRISTIAYPIRFERYITPVSPLTEPRERKSASGQI